MGSDSVLDRINKPNDIKSISPEDYPKLASEIRKLIIRTVSRTGGHLAPSLGVVELTMALHVCLDLPQDKLIWDVGHQAYAHKILTGRKDDFSTLRQYKGISGFPKMEESSCDAFDTGHSTTSLSAALGYAKARDIKGEKYTIAAVIGDGAMTGGMAFEALNNMEMLRSNLIIILNDNTMSISRNVGGFSQHLTEMRTKESYLDFKDELKNALGKVPKVGDRLAGMLRQSKDDIRKALVQDGFFEGLGIRYFGPVDGHDTVGLINIINSLKRVNRPVVLHVVTQKGRGYKPAEENPDIFHGIGAFDIKTGMPVKSPGRSWTSAFSDKMVELGKDHPDVAAITAAMPDGTGLKAFQVRYPDRFFDVGIAEQHAVTFAAGLAAGGMKPFFAVYSSFLQRAFDQIVHDVCLQKLPVVLCIDRAGLVGQDGPTHHGTLDLSYLSAVPNMTICAPMDLAELSEMMEFAYHFEAPIAVRYPRGNGPEDLAAECGVERTPLETGKSMTLVKGSCVAFAAAGGMVQTALEAGKILSERGYEPEVINARFIKPLDTEMLDRLNSEGFELLVTMEDNMIRGGFGEACADYIKSKNYPIKVIHIGVPDIFAEQGSIGELKEALGMDAAAAAREAAKELESEGEA
ncbi:MAG: 1-deoxy-D-xylulose-5-phosphate synthase [Lachnospiraceae bacterium]|nr:1-deoxy-D-xylulose-5-phosphate synthase [Lachnospiraceae bacterium]